MGSFAAQRDPPPPALLLPGAWWRRRAAAALGVALCLLSPACGPTAGGGNGGDGGGGDAGGADLGSPDRWAPWYGTWNSYSPFYAPGKPDYGDSLRYNELEFRGDGTVVIAREFCPGLFIPPAPEGELTYRHEDLYTWEIGENGYPRLAFVSHSDEETVGHLYPDAVELEVRPGPGCDELEVWGRREDASDLTRWDRYAPGDLCVETCAELGDYATYSLFDYCDGAPPPPCE